MRFAMILNKEERERPTMERIRRWIDDGTGTHRTLIVDYHRTDLLPALLEFAPQVVLTFPFTAAPVSQPFVLLKKLLGCHVVCLRAEGVVDFSSEQHVRWFAGMDSYPPTLVDHELAWGRRSADVLAEVLTRQGKLSDPGRVRHFGHPGLEPHFEETHDPDASIPPRLLERLAATERRNVAFFITGFHLAEYSRTDLVNAGDIVRRDDPDYERRLDEACEGAERARRFRAAWVETVLRCARRNPGALLVVKAHPIEKIFHKDLGRADPYAPLRDLPNVVHLYDNVPVGSLLARSGLFLHYGSTCAVEPYLLRVPSVFVTSRAIYGDPSRTNSFDYSDMGWPSRWNADLEELPELLADHLAAPLGAMDGSSPMDGVMEELFSIRRSHVDGSEPYLPSRDIAAFLRGLADQAPQEIALDDPFLEASLRAWGNRFVEWCAARTQAAPPLRSRAAWSQIARLGRIAGVPAPEVERALDAGLSGFLEGASPRARRKLERILSPYAGRGEELALAAAELLADGERGVAERVRALLVQEDPAAAALVAAGIPDAREVRAVAIARRPNRHPPLDPDRAFDRARRLARCGETVASVDMLLQIADEVPERAVEACSEALSVAESSGMPVAGIGRRRFVDFEPPEGARILEVGVDFRQTLDSTSLAPGAVGAEPPRLAWKDGSFDFVVCGAGLLACADPIGLCSELQRVAPAGMLDAPGRASPERTDGARWSVAVEDGALVFEEVASADGLAAWRAVIGRAAEGAATGRERALDAIRILQGEPWNVRHCWDRDLAVSVRRRDGRVERWRAGTDPVRTGV